jgi:hypothetical protein
VRRVRQLPHSMLDNLGCKGSDLLQTNGIIWVEGPSDVILIRKWIEMHVAENGDPTVRQGSDYEFQMYGGALLDSLCLINEGLSQPEELKKLVEMFSFSRNAYVVIDSDAITENGVVLDKSKFVKAKQLINTQFETLIEAGYKLGLWYEEGNTDVQTLEDYLDSDTLMQHPNRGKPTKKLYAQKVVKSWPDTKLLSEFPHDLSQQIRKLVAVIRSWQT